MCFFSKASSHMKAGVSSSVPSSTLVLRSVANAYEENSMPRVRVRASHGFSSRWRFSSHVISHGKLRATWRTDRLRQACRKRSSGRASVVAHVSLSQT